jgi:hypothetical protein
MDGIRTNVIMRSYLICRLSMRLLQELFSLVTIDTMHMPVVL